MISDEVRQGYPVAAALEDTNSSFITGGTVQFGELTLYIQPDLIVDACRVLKNQWNFRLSAVTAVDWHPLDPRFEVVYLVQCFDPYLRLRLKVKAAECQDIDSVTSVWSGANWYEREVFDLFGVKFRNHPDLRRIMLPDDWDGHPLRKDFPTAGHKYSYADEGSAL